MPMPPRPIRVEEGLWPRIEYDPIPLKKYADTVGRLAPEDKHEALTLELWRRWIAVPDTSMSCHVLVLDFDGIRDVKDKTVSDVIVYFLGGAVVVGSRPAYVVCENVANDDVFRGLQSGLRDAERLLIVRRKGAGELDYELVGHREKREKFSRYFTKLTRGKDFTGSWVYAGPLYKLPKPEQWPKYILKAMYEEGIALQGPAAENMFRSPMPRQGQQLAQPTGA